MASLSLVAFEVFTGADSLTHVLLTVKGTAKLYPDNVTPTKGPKGTRVVEIVDPAGDADAAAQLTAMGACTQFPDDPPGDNADASWYGWVRDGFVTASNGGGLADPEEPAAETPEEQPEEPAAETPEEQPEEPAAETPEEQPEEPAAETPEEQPEEQPEEAPAAVAEPSRAEELGKLTAADLKALAAKYTAHGFATAATGKKAEIVAALVATEAELLADADDMRAALAQKVSAVKAYIGEVDTVSQLRRLSYHEDAGKGRKSILQCLSDAIVSLEVAPVVDPQPAPKVAASEAKKAKKAKEAPKKAKKAAKPATLDKDKAVAREAAKAERAERAAKRREAKAAARREAKAAEETQQAELAELVDGARAATKALLKATQSSRVTRLLISRMIAEEEGKISGVAHVSASHGKPLQHVPGRIWSVSKAHRNEWGLCHYEVECLEGGGYRIVSCTGNRRDVKAGATYPNANEMLRVLTGRDYPRVQVYRYFNGCYRDPKPQAKAAK